MVGLVLDAGVWLKWLSFRNASKHEEKQMPPRPKFMHAPRALLLAASCLREHTGETLSRCSLAGQVIQQRSRTLRPYGN